MTDGIDVIFFERFRHHLDLMAQGGPRSILCLMAEEKGYQAMIEAAQSEGVTVVRVGKNGLMTYYPGAHDFSVPIFWERWRFAQRDLFSFDLDPFRPEEEFLPHHGPQKWHSGPVELERFSPEEERKCKPKRKRCKRLIHEAELDRRVFHKWINQKDWEVNGTQIIGTYKRPGFRLNDTLRMALGRSTSMALSQATQQPKLMSGAKYFNEDLDSLMQKGPEAAESVQMDLAALKEEEEAYAVLLWNHDSHKLLPFGATQREVLARVVRWWEGFLEMPVRRVEAADFVEPWDRLGAHALDWLYQMPLLNMTVDRLWPPRGEAINRNLLRKVSRFARAKAEDRWVSPKIDRPPRLVIVMTEDLCFDLAIEEAQRAGPSPSRIVWKGPQAASLMRRRQGKENQILTIVQLMMMVQMMMNFTMVHVVYLTLFKWCLTVMSRWKKHLLRLWRLLRCPKIPKLLPMKGMKGQMIAPVLARMNMRWWPCRFLLSTWMRKVSWSMAMRVRLPKALAMTKLTQPLSKLFQRAMEMIPIMLALQDLPEANLILIS
eukprot:g2252.t1